MESNLLTPKTIITPTGNSYFTQDTVMSLASGDTTRQDFLVTSE